MPAEPETTKRSPFPLGLQAIGLIKPSQIASVAAAFAMTFVLTGTLDGAEQRLSDAWFAASKIAPSGRTVLETFNHRAVRYAYTNRVPHRDLAEVLSKLDFRPVSRFLMPSALRAWSAFRQHRLWLPQEPDAES
jgi:hypothetical protein